MANKGGRVRASVGLSIEQAGVLANAGAPLFWTAGPLRPRGQAGFARRRPL